MSLLKDLQGLNAAYAEVHASMQENQDKGYVVTAADKKGNTKAWQGYKSGVKSKTTGKPLYRAADHLKKEEANRESQLWDQVAANLTELHELRGVKYKVVPFSEHHQKDASGKVIEHGDATPSSLDEKKGAHAEMDRQRKAAKKLHKPERWQDNDGDGKWYEPGVDVKKESVGSAIDKTLSAAGEVADTAIKLPAKAVGYAKGLKKGLKKASKEGEDKAASSSSPKEEMELLNKLVESGQFTQEEIDAIVEADRLGKLEESEKVAQGAQKRAEVLASRRRQKGYKEKGYNAYRPGKNEKAGYNLSRAARSSDASPETQRTKKKKPAGEDTSQIGHYKKRDEKVTVGKRGKPLKQPKYKLSMGQRVDHHSNKAWSRRDPKQNPKHTANK